MKAKTPLKRAVARIGDRRVLKPDEKLNAYKMAFKKLR